MARKVPGYVIEPCKGGYSEQWEGHHATNPTALRLSSDPRVFLGYRAGGAADHYSLDGKSVWGSHLGLAILSERGDEVTRRFPLPIMTLETDVRLPQTKEEYREFQKGPHKDEIVVLHDFRFWEDRGWLYVIYHEGSLGGCFDCIVRMKVAAFLEKIERSIALSEAVLGGGGGAAGGRESAGPDTVMTIRDEWRALWWEEGVWKPCGVDGTNRIYSSPTNKNDIVFIRLNDGTLRMLHRPVPDIAFLDTGQDVFSRATPDGITAFGSLQSCIRPGGRDNSHIGNNGVPIRVKIGDVPVFMDVAHGVHNEQVSDPRVNKWKMTYQPYLRLLDTDTGECLYYSEQPVLAIDDIWREYVEEGEWIRALDHLDAVMFAGGQIEMERGRNGLDDLFTFYTGVGDTAVARAEFRLRELLPPEVVEDMLSRDGKQKAADRGEVDMVPGRAPGALFPEKLCGWEWTLSSDQEHRTLMIQRRLERSGYREEADRVVSRRPGYFDADGLAFDGKSLWFHEGLGWIVLYRGYRWEMEGKERYTSVGCGILLLDRENPERIFYRSMEPLEGRLDRVQGWNIGGAFGLEEGLADMREEWIPQKVKAEVKRYYKVKPLAVDMTRWLKMKSGQLEEERMR